jgi:hypothetical protein
VKPIATLITNLRQGVRAGFRSLHRVATSLLPVLLMLVPAAVQGQAGLPLWTNRYSGPGNGDDFATALGVDAGGNVFVTGYSTGSAYDYDYATIKYSSAGMPLWTNRYNGPGNSNDWAYGLVVDGSGDVVVTGSSYGVGSGYDYLTIKYSGAGMPLWTNRYNGPLNREDRAEAVAVDSSGNVYVTGSSEAGSYVYDYATLAYSSAGVPLWTNRYNGTGNGDDSACSVAVDPSGNVIVTGSSYGVGSGYDYLTIKYSSGGVPLWTNRFNLSMDVEDRPSALAVDTSGNVVVTGASGLSYQTVKYSSAGIPLWTNLYVAFPGSEAVAVDAQGNVFVAGSVKLGFDEYGYDYLTLAYSNSGVLLWTHGYCGEDTFWNAATAVAVDARGNVYVTGGAYDGGNNTGADYATIAYSGAGVGLWTNRYNGPGNWTDCAQAAAVDAMGNVFVTGYSQAGDGYDYDYTTIKYASALPTPPVVTNVVLTGMNLAFSGTGGIAGGTYYVLTATNIAGRMTSWARLATNTFDVGGSFSVTNAMDPARCWQFLRIEEP